MVVFASLSMLGENIAHPHLSFRSPLFYLRERSTVSKAIYLQNFVVTTTIHATAFDLSWLPGRLDSPLSNTRSRDCYNYMTRRISRIETQAL